MDGGLGEAAQPGEPGRQDPQGRRRLQLLVRRARRQHDVTRAPRFLPGVGRLRSQSGHRGETGQVTHRTGETR